MKHLINKIVVMFACAFVITFASNHSCSAQEMAAAPKANPEVADIDLNEIDADIEGIASKEADKVNSEAMAGDEKTAVADKQMPKAMPQEAPEVSEEDISFLNEDSPEDVLKTTPKAPAGNATAPEEKAAPVKAAPLLDIQPFPDNEENLEALETDVNKAQIDSTTDVDAVIPEIGESKSPFENFGNAILSKVDNDLFNQMSNIEKQTTLLRLELRREELKTRVEALRTARLKAQQEEDARIRAEEERAKDLEAERQAKIVSEQEKLKDKEIELEKVRQSKVVNDYMNEMLEMNQNWVNKNAELQNRIHELEEENKALYKDFKDKIVQINESIVTLVEKSEKAVASYKRKMESLNSHINQLKSSMMEREDEIKQLSNPFAGEGAPSKDAIDMSREYAIMDITGKGDDVIAKIVSRDGTTFIVHKGSMLKNGEVVTSITDHYISFENDGVQSYLYTGGTVMEYEPLVTFNGSDKTPVQTEKAIVKGDSSNVLGGAARFSGKKKEEEIELVKKPRKAGGNLSFGSGTFIQ